jgi:hypothetical protein
MAPVLIPCAHCGCHAKSVDVQCPSCGEPLRRNDGSVPRTAVAVLLGLTAAGALAGSCGDSGPVVEYGIAMTTSSSGTGSTSSAGAGTGGATASSSSTGPMPAYGIAETTSSSSGGGGNDGG